MHYLGATDRSIKIGTMPNPCRDFMETFAERVGLDLIVNVVPDTRGESTAVVSGHYVRAHRAGVEIAKKSLTAFIREPADLVLVSAYPSDMDLLQAGKALFAAERCVAPGGEIILLSPCYEGIAPAHPDIADYCAHTTADLVAGIDAGSWDSPLRAAFAIGLKRLAKSARISVLTEKISASELEKIGYSLIPDHAGVAERVAAAARSGKHIGVVDYGSKVLPTLSRDRA